MEGEFFKTCWDILWSDFLYWMVPGFIDLCVVGLIVKYTSHQDKKSRFLRGFLIAITILIWVGYMTIYCTTRTYILLLKEKSDAIMELKEKNRLANEQINEIKQQRDSLFKSIEISTTKKNISKNEIADILQHLQDFIDQGYFMRIKVESWLNQYKDYSDCPQQAKIAEWNAKVNLYSKKHIPTYVQELFFPNKKMPPLEGLDFQIQYLITLKKEYKEKQ